MSLSLIEIPRVPKMRPGERFVWTAQPRWRALAVQSFRIRMFGLYVCALLFGNALAARMQHMSPIETLHAEVPVVVMGALLLGGVAAWAWATGRTTRYTVTNQRVILQFGVAMTATMAVPMRLIRSVAVSEGTVANIPITLKPGTPESGPRVPYYKLWPHAQPWRIAVAVPMLLALPDAETLAARLAATVAAAQQIERIAPAEADMKLAAD